ncbi:MAG: hypothetical protein H7647_09510 [Candidatus Heimdallarchaeota archaeon]|nr:hypothetical protein [Candidatus Heimdallarchaeota archaeon]MCK4254665.1 hypothetical protein [Candidatus Heimdallarchaeota archaeon]
MKYRKLLFVILVFVSLSTINQGSLLVDDGISDYDNYQNNDKVEEITINGSIEDSVHGNNYREYTVSNVEQGFSDLEDSWEENNVSLTETLDSFNPNVSLEANYTGQEIAGKIEDGDSIISVPDQGMYNLRGEIVNMEVQYVQNSGAEVQESFYSDDVMQAGLSIERTADPRSIEGDNVWKFYSSNTETMTYSLYQENIELYQTDTRISYNYLLESNSSLQNVINSSLIFDIVFDTCRIMVIHWHYTDIDPPEIGENTTTPFVVYRLLENSSWNDQWNFYSLEISDLFDQGDPYIPTVLKSIGIYVISPEYSECSLLIDEFKVTSPVSPEDIDLELNDFSVSSTNISSGAVDIDVHVDETNLNNEIDLKWNHNSTFEIKSEYILNITGTIMMQFSKNIQTESDTTISYTITTNQISSEINQINITYPEYWILDENIENFQIQNIENIGETQAVLTLLKIGSTTNLNCQFTIQNLINKTIFSELTIFEMLNATVEFSQPIDEIPVFAFWSGIENGSMKGYITNETMNLNFPSWVHNGTYDVTFIVMDADTIGFTSTTISLIRLPSQLIVLDQIEMPQFTLQILDINYLDLESGQAIEESSLIVYLDNEEIPVEENGNIFRLHLSAFYLELGEVKLDIWAASQTHATIIESIKINVIESTLEASFTYTKMDSGLHYQFDFCVTANSLPVGNAPVRIEIETIGTVTGITDSWGEYSFEIQLPLNQKEIYVNCSVINKYNPIFTESYEIQFSDLQVNIVQEGEVRASSDNITLVYKIQYPENHDRWFAIIEEEMTPIINAYIEADTLRIPVYWDDNVIYWEAETEKSNENHKLIVETTGPEVSTNIEEKNDEIVIHFIIDARTKSYTNISLVYHLNESYVTSKYTWQVFSSKEEDVTELYGLQINDLYVLLSNVDIAKGSYLVLDLVGVKKTNANAITNIVIPVVSSSSVLLGAIATIVKVYNKKKGMILEI